MTDDTLYAKDTGDLKASYPDVDLQDPLYIVRNVQVNDGLNPPYNYDYTYAGAKANFLGRGSLGFRQTVITDSSANSKTTTYNNQTFPKIGLPSAVEIDKLSDATAWRDTNYDYQTDNPYPSAPTVSFVKASSVDIVEWEGGETSRTLHKEMTYDSTTRGNLAQVHDYGDLNDPNDDRYEVTDWVVNTDAWIHRPIRQALLDKNGGVLREKWLYYDNQGYGTTPTFGLLTKEEVNGGDPQGSGNNNPVTGKNPVTTYVNDPTVGVRTAVTDPRGCTTTITYEPSKTYPQTITNCMLPSVGYRYDARFGVKTYETDVNGPPTHYDYDGFGRLTKVIGPSDSENLPTIQYDYPSWGTPTAQNVQTSRRIQHGAVPVLVSAEYFDGLGRVYQNAKDGPSGKTIQSEATLDSRGLVVYATAPHFTNEAAVTTSFRYDPLARLRQIIHPDRPPMVIDYFVPGRVDITDENGHLKRKWFDAYKRLIRVDEFNNGGAETYTTTYDYDAAGSLLTVTNSAGHLTTMAYDPLGRRIALCDPNMGTPSTLTTCSITTQRAWVYTYNPAGDLLTQTDAKGQTLTFTYDLLGRPTFKKQGLTTLIQWTYDTSSISPPPIDGDYPIGRLTQIDQPQTGTITRFAYNNVGDTIQSKRQLLGVWYTMSQHYDALHRVDSETFNDGEIVTYNYDGEWVNLITSSNSGNYINDVEYNARGQKTDITYRNGLLSHFDYDPNNFRLTAHTTVNPQTLNYFQNLGYLYDNVGNVTSIQDNLGGGTAGRNFQYDDLNRLTYAEGTFGAGQAFTSCTYQYSPIGNPDKCSYTFSYGDAMHPSAVTYNPATSKNYSYDTDGNMMTRGTPTLTWDIDNRVTSISSQGGTTYMNYDDDGVRVEKNAPTGITLYPFSGVEIDPNGVMTKHIRIGGETFASKKGTNQYFYHNDHLGGINVITDISCTDINCIEVQRNEYDPWGNVSKAVGNIDPTHRFTGQELDPETGLYYYGGRYYDAEISRFVSPDPFVPSPDDPQSLNRYSYTINNPQRYIDPSGYDVGDSSYQYSFGLYGWVRFFIDVFSSHHHRPKPRRTSISHPMNQPRERNWGGPLSDSVRVYVDEGNGTTLNLLQIASNQIVWEMLQGDNPGPGDNNTCNNAQASAFVSANGAYANEIEQRTGISATNLLGLSALESNFGTSNLATKYNNYFGLTVGRAFKGTTGVFTTSAGRNFGIYPSPGFLTSGLSFAQSFQGRRVTGVTDPVTFAQRLTTRPLAFNSEPGYAGKLVIRINQVSVCQ